MKGTTIIGAIALLSSSALAEITFTGMGPYFQQASIAGHTSGTFYAGLLEFADPGNQCGLGNSFTTICVDLDHSIGGGSHWPANCSHSNTLGDGLQAAGNIIAAYYGSLDSDPKAAGLQLAVWEAVYDDGGTADFGLGNFRVTNASAEALAWGQFYYDNGRNTAGDCLYITPQPGYYGQGQMAPVPEPAALGILVIGLAAFLRRRVRRSA